MISLIFLLILISIALFLFSEGRKKIDFMGKFTKDSTHLLRYSYSGKDTKPGMYNVKLSADVPFKVMIGIELNMAPFLQGFDPYGFIASRNNTVVFSTYLGKVNAEFVFFLEGVTAQEVKLEFGVEGNPQEVYEPHWWQRLGLFS
ncbi:hypothetical protein IT409_00895 [Candidatus Falkowbacteria bacterium]|nr:hypothetical protein [Candidatus Falkowbacteria bacterium]